MLLCKWRYWLFVPTLATLTWILLPAHLYGHVPDSPRAEALRKSSFLLWTHESLEDPSQADDLVFILEMAAELQHLGHTVRVEGPKTEGLISGVRVTKNPLLNQVLRGQIAPWDAVKSELPDFVICFSSVWNSTFFQLPESRPLRMVWYFYWPSCLPEDAGQEKKLGYAMVNADRVIFSRKAEERRWSAYGHGHFSTFRPFVRRVILPEELNGTSQDQLKNASRKRIRSHHGLHEDDFILTVWHADACSGPLNVSDIVPLVQKRFGSSWLLIIIGQSRKEAKLKNILRVDRNQLHKYLLAADLHVSLSWPDFARDSIHARALGIPVLMPASELAGTTSVDSFQLPTAFNTSGLNKALSNVLDLRPRKRLSVARAGKFTVHARFTEHVVTTRVQHLVDVLRVAPRSGPKIGIFLQLHDADRWHDLWPCVEAVLNTSYSVDVFLSTTHKLDALQPLIAKLEPRVYPALRFHLLSHVENRGADIGVFLQQLLLASELSLESDIILKAHTKKLKKWRDLMVNSLCGSTETVQRIVRKFMNDDGIGMVGPANLTWRMHGPKDHVAMNLSKPGFDKWAIEQMQFAWGLLVNSESPLPPKKNWTIVAGSFWWVRPDLPVWHQEILPFAPRLLATMGVYKHSCRTIQCKAALGLERIIPTLIAGWKRIDVGDIP